MNEYSGYKSGGKCWEAMQTQADEYRVKATQKDGTVRERALRADAVVGWATIINPPAEMTVGWTKAQYDKFYRDSFDALEHIEPRLFRADNIRMTAEHHDEGLPDENGEFSDHLHIIGDATDKDGKYCGNLIDAKLFVKINEGYPAFMRSRGWDLEDVDQTDFSRMGKNEDGTYKDPEYRAARLAKQKAKPAGRTVNKYVADQTRQNYEDAAQTMEQAIVEKNKARHEYIEADKARREAEREAEETKAAAKAEAEAEARKIKADAESEAAVTRAMAKGEAEDIKAAAEAATATDRAEAARQLADAQRAVKTLRDGLDGIEYYRGLAAYADLIKFPDGETVRQKYEAQRKAQQQQQQQQEQEQEQVKTKQEADDAIRKAMGTADTVNEKKQQNRAYQGGKNYP